MENQPNPSRQLVLPFGQFEVGLNKLLARASTEEEEFELQGVLFEYWVEQYSEHLPCSDPEE